jgi:hypothetical protein
MTSQKYQSKWLVKNVNLGLVKKHMAQSQWTSLVQNDWEVFLHLSKMGIFLPKFLVKKKEF